MVKEIPEEQRGALAVAKQLYNEFSEDDVMTQSAAVAFYTGLALAPVLTVAVWITKAFFPGNAKERIVGAFESVLGYQAAYPIREMLDPAEKAASTGMNVAGLISIALVLFSASGVFAQLQSALNLIWDVEAKPSAGIWAFIRKRFLSFGMLLTILFLLLTSLVVSAVIQGMIGVNPESTSWMSAVVNTGVSLVIYVVLFATMFRYLPDVRIDWKDVWVGAVITAVLFSLGRFGLSIYLGRTAPADDPSVSEQGQLYAKAIGTFVAFLLWVYYSGIIVLVGAEATQIYTRHKGHGLRPNKYSQLVETKKEPIDVGGTRS
jgi:membrane protein